MFQPGNKLDVMQSLMLYNILIKKKVILDQFRRGLSILGFLKEMEKNPHLFEQCFIKKDDISTDSVTNCLYFTPTEDNNARRVFQMLLNFIKNCNNEHLCDFLKFITGSSSLPRRIKVSCGITDSIYASTCLMALTLPSNFESYATFEAAMRCVVKGKTFTTP